MNSTSFNATDYCPFDQLPMEILVKIIDLLKPKDLVNLAQTCHRWNQLFQSAPESKKLKISKEEILATCDGFLDSYQLTKQFDPSYKFTLVKNLTCGSIKIKGDLYKEGSYTSEEILKFLVENRSHIKIAWLEIKTPFRKSDLQILDSIVDMASHIYIKYKGDEFEDSTKFEDEVFLTNHLSHKYIVFRFTVKFEVINMFLRQWLEGRRKNLLCFWCVIEQVEQTASRRDHLKNIYDQITDGLIEFVQPMAFRDENIHFKLNVPGLPSFTVTLDGKIFDFWNNEW